MSENAAAEGGPAFRVLRGNPTPEEVAAITAALLVLPRGGRPARSEWADRRRLLRVPPAAGPGRWRSSGLPG